MRIFLLPPEKLTNHCLHCHVFTKAPLPCEVTGIFSWTLLSNLPTIVNRNKTITFWAFLRSMGGDKTGIFNQMETPAQTCCAVVFCSKDCRRKATQGYHRFREPLIMISRSIFLRYECEMRLYELLPLEGKDMFGYFLALRWRKNIYRVSLSSLTSCSATGQSPRGTLTTFLTTSKCSRWSNLT